MVVLFTHCIRFKSSWFVTRLRSDALSCAYILYAYFVHLRYRFIGYYVSSNLASFGGTSPSYRSTASAPLNAIIVASLLSLRSFGVLLDENGLLTRFCLRLRSFHMPCRHSHSLRHYMARSFLVDIARSILRCPRFDIYYIFTRPSPGPHS